MSEAAADWLLSGRDLPWPVTVPFRMRPNLRRLGDETLLLADARRDAYRRERMTALADRPAVGVAHAGVLAAIAALQAGLSPVDAAARALIVQPPASDAVALGMQEDFVILRRDDDAFRSEYLSVAFPSRWDPATKLEQDFATIHAPVADGGALVAAAPAFMPLAFAREAMLRYVWLVVPSPALDQHPSRNQVDWQRVLADPEPLLPRLFFRVERQTTWPLVALDRAVFFIRLLMAPLAEVVDAAPGRRRVLADAVRSMSPAVVAYRGMAEAAPRLVAELEAD